MANTLQVPTQPLKKFVRAAEALDELQEAFEDFLISHNPALLRKLRRGRREDLAGETRPFDEFERELRTMRTSR